MKALLGILLIVVGVLLGLYVGVWVCFIGGIVGLVNVLIHLINHTQVTGMNVAVNIAKIIFAGLAGYLSALFLILPGFALINKD
jgi:hypothetical protein